MTYLQSARDQTPLNVARAANLTVTAPAQQAGGPLGSYRNNSYVDRTPFVVSQPVTRSRGRHVTSRTSSEWQASPTVISSAVEGRTDNLDRETENIRDRRLQLLVAKFENGTTYEDDARLQLLTARLRRLAPRVTAESVNALKAAADTVENASSELEAMKQRLGIV